MPFIDANGVSLHYELAGASGHSVVLLHELGGTLRSWDGVAPPLAGRRRVLRYDQRGAGLSEKVRRDFSNDMLVDDFEALAKSAGLDPPYSFVTVAAAATQALRYLERYPDRERPTARTKPDGSWEADETRKLTPEQNAEVDRGIDRIREVGKNIIVPGMRAVEAEDASRCLAGFDNRFKGEDRLKEKVADQLRSTPGLTPKQALAAIPDAVRFTLQYSETTYTTAVLKDTEVLTAHGFTQVERRNTWGSDQYKGINSRWREPESGVIFEVQFHTQASLEAKELTHKAYERIRGSAEDPELAELKEFQRGVNSMIPTPPEVADIEDYPPGES